jgi:hypothetical protein
MTQLCPHQKIAPVPHEDLPDLRNTIQIALEQKERGGLQSLRVLARSGVNIRHSLQKGDHLIRRRGYEIAANTRLQTRADVGICHWRLVRPFYNAEVKGMPLNQT